MLKISQSVKAFSNYCNRVAKCSKAWQTNGKIGNFGGAGFSALWEVISVKKIFATAVSVAKYYKSLKNGGILCI